MQSFRENKYYKPISNSEIISDLIQIHAKFHCASHKCLHNNLSITRNRVIVCMVVLGLPSTPRFCHL